MSLFKNNYQKLIEDNNEAIAELSGDSWGVLARMFKYLESFDVSLFELEVIKKDLIGLAREAELEKTAFLEKIGMSEKEFCDSLVKGGIKRGGLERVIPRIKNSSIELFVFYALWWCFEGMPKDYGITLWMATFTIVADCYQSTIGFKLRSRKLYQSEASRKMKTIVSFVGITAIFLVACFSEVFILRGNGRIIFVALLIISAVMFFGNNIYWDKCSDKYNWR